MVLPAAITPAFEVVETQVILEFAILLFDRPATARQRDEIAQGRRVRQVDQVERALVGGGSFAQQPAIAAPLGRPDAHGAEPRGQRAVGARAPGDGVPRLGGRRGGRRGGNGRRGLSAGHVRDGEGRAAANGHAIGEAQSLQPGAKRGVAAVVGIDHDAGDREARLEHGPHLRQRHPPLLAKDQGRRNADGGAAGGIVHPHGRQIQVPREGPRAPVGDQRTRAGDLAIPDLSQRAAVLAVHPDRVRPLLGKARVIDRQDPRAHRHGRPQLRPHAGRVPRRMRDEVLEGLIRAGITESAMHRLHRLPFAVVEQAVEIPTDRLALRLATETGAEPVRVAAHAAKQGACGVRGHARDGTESRRAVQAKSALSGRNAQLNLAESC